MIREGYASRILADVMRIIAEENNTKNKNVNEVNDKSDENKQKSKENKDEDTN